MENLDFFAIRALVVLGYREFLEEYKTWIVLHDENPLYYDTPPDLIWHITNALRREGVCREKGGENARKVSDTMRD